MVGGGGGGGGGRLLLNQNPFYEPIYYEVFTMFYENVIHILHFQH